MEAEGRETILARKGIIIKEIEIKQDPIVELKATGVETWDKHKNNHSVHATLYIVVVI